MKQMIAETSSKWCRYIEYLCTCLTQQST